MTSVVSLRAQSFTSLKADLRLDINRGFTIAGVLMEQFLEGSFGKLTQKRIFVFVTLLIWVNVPMY